MVNSMNWSPLLDSRMVAMYSYVFVCVPNIDGLIAVHLLRTIFCPQHGFSDRVHVIARLE